MNTDKVENSPLELLAEKFEALVAGDEQIRAAVPLPSVNDAVRKPGLSTAEIMEAVLEGYADRPALGERVYHIAQDSSERELDSEFSTITYAELRRRIHALASAWQNHSMHRVGADDFVCILGFTGVDFAVVDMATAYVQAVTVPLQTILTFEQLAGVLKDTAPASVFATVSDLEQSVELAIDNGAIHSVVVMDYDSRVSSERNIFEAAQQRIDQSGAQINLARINELLDYGSDISWQPPKPHPDGLERLNGLVHSSGSTGTPKGVMIPDRAMNYAWVGPNPPEEPVVTTAFAPMDHFLGRHQIHITLTSGGTVNFTTAANLTTLFEDIRLTRPTSLFLFPRVMELIYQHFKNEVSRRVEAGEGTNAEVEILVQKEMRSTFLGDRLCVVTYGSAATPPEVVNFVRDCFEVVLMEGYGSTEGGQGNALNGRITRPPVLDYKLRDVPELGYFLTDKPYPRGELLVKATTQTPGYYKRPKLTESLFDEHGYVITGDIVEERGQDHVVYIDRRNDVLKLSQAEFVAPGKLGAIFEGGCSSVYQSYVYGNSTRAYLLAVIVPDIDFVETELGPNPSEDEIKSIIRKELQALAKSADLRAFEVPRDFIIEMEPFSIENGLLTSVRKRRRPNLLSKYGDSLEALYTELEEKREKEIEALKDKDSPLSTVEKVTKLIEATLGIYGISPTTQQSFTELGGDSLASVTFGMMVENVFGVLLPVNSIVSPAGNPGRWAEAIDALLAREVGSSVVSFESIHLGKDVTTLHASDLDIINFLDGQIPDTSDIASVSDQPRNVLVTGANGFLGRFLCLEWMERVAPRNGKVVCLIRAGSDELARKRLDEVYSGIAPKLQSRYHKLAENHLEVLAGDIGEVNLGLSSEVWTRLANELDHIVHPAALVNHVLSYQHLFVPNVWGTAQLIKFAITGRLKRFDFVSSLATASIISDDSASNEGYISREDSPLPDTLTLDDSYACGYGASKWANEIQLRSANKRFGLPVNIFRGDMMMPHRSYEGQINIPDMLTRLLYSIVVTGLAPHSFYQLDSEGRRAEIHYDGLPVDFIADTLVGIGDQTGEGVSIYNVLNYHYDDGISLDSFVDWIETAGYPVQRVKDHSVWAQQFSDKMGTLTHEQRQHSAVELMHLYNNPLPNDERGYGCKRFKEAIRNLPVGPEVPHLSESYIHKYLNDMVLLNLIPEAQVPRNNNG